MHLLPKIIVGFLMVVILNANNSAVAFEASGFQWLKYEPAAMSSVDLAITKIKDLKGFLYTSQGYPIRELSVDSSGMRVLGVDEGVKQGEKKVWIGWDIVSLPTNVPYRNEENAAFTFKNMFLLNLYHWQGTHGFMIVSNNVSFQADSVEVACRFADAIFTLALAQGADFPYLGFLVYPSDSTNKLIQAAYKKNKVSSGSVVSLIQEGGPDLMRNDIIVEVMDGEKTYPITTTSDLVTVCRVAVAGKAETPLVLKVIRDGVAMTKNIRAINLGFGVKVLQSGSIEVQTQVAPPKGFGLSLRPIETEEAKAIGLTTTSGFMVLSVQKDSAADKMQIKPNDVLLSLNGVDITSATQLQDLVAKGPNLSAKVFRAGMVVPLQAPLMI